MREKVDFCLDCSILTREFIESCEKRNMTVLRNGSCMDPVILASMGGNVSTIELSRALSEGFRLNNTLPSDEYFQ